eukprot:TRINITY_DN203_c0_g1_i13.p2 TRINITY_DN203_c0_g1~~TRINITY_DN203_c0_g1_i13.p2  ORF type:complete len:226 (+),score=71.92 TRINITY_DN203_c0_g1_i13:243-920(+)
MLAIDLIIIGGFGFAYGLLWVLGDPEHAYHQIGLGTGAAGGVLVLGTGLYMSTGTHSDDYYEYMLVFEMSIAMLGLTWYKCDGDLSVVKMAEALVTAALGLSIEASEETLDDDGVTTRTISTLTPHLDAKQVAWSAMLVALTAIMYAYQPTSRNLKLGAVAWMLFGEWMLMEAMFEEHHKDSEQMFGAAHWSALLCINWVLFLFFRDSFGPVSYTHLTLPTKRIV